MSNNESAIDPTVFPDNRKVNKPDLREQFTIAKTEITALMQQASPMRRIAFDDSQFDTL